MADAKRGKRRARAARRRRSGVGNKVDGRPRAELSTRRPTSGARDGDARRARPPGRSRRGLFAGLAAWWRLRAARRGRGLLDLEVLEGRLELRHWAEEAQRQDAASAR